MITSVIHSKLFDLDTVDESIVEGDGINFDKEDIRRNLTLFLYPDDSDYQGQLLQVSISNTLWSAMQRS